MVTTSNYYAEKDDDTCNSCFTCVDRCNVHAIKIDNERTVISREKCIGCGLCASTCPTGSITMVQQITCRSSRHFLTRNGDAAGNGEGKGKEIPVRVELKSKIKS